MAYNLVFLKKKNSEQTQGDSFSINCCSAKKRRKKDFEVLSYGSDNFGFSKDSVVNIPIKGLGCLNTWNNMLSV